MAARCMLQVGCLSQEVDSKTEIKVQKVYEELLLTGPTSVPKIKG